ncbi:hypothetical protein UT300018_21170 [Clostridium faecium]
MVTSLKDNLKYANVNFKEHFIEEIEKKYSKTMKLQYINIFKNVLELEEHVFKKDLYDFTKDEIKNTLKAFNAKTYNSITSKYSLIKKYIKYAEEMKIKRCVMNFSIKADEIKDLICNEDLKNRYCTRTELNKALSEKLINGSDKAIFILLFEGIMGKAYFDLLNLKTHQIDLDNKIIRLKDKIVNISNFTKEILLETINEDIYYKYIGDVCNTNESYTLDTTSPYLIKLRPKRDYVSPQPMKIAGLKRRLDVLKNIMEKPLLTGRTIYLSGLAERIVKYEISINRKLNTREIREFLSDNNETVETGDMLRILKLMREKILKDLNYKMKISFC